MLQAMAGHDPKDSTSVKAPVPDYRKALTGDVRGLKVGIPREYRIDGMAAEGEKLWQQGIAWLKAAGAEPVDISLPHTKYALPTYYIIAPAEASANLARYDGIRYGLSDRDGGDVLANYLATRGRGFGAEVKRRIMLGTYALSAGYYDAFYLKAQKVRTLIKADFDAAFAWVDALVAPTSPTVAFPLGARLDDPVSMYLSDACTLPVNIAGLPGISVPCGLSDGLPVGLQFISRAWDEGTLFRLGRAYEAITADDGWRHLKPSDQTALDDPTTPTPMERLAAATA
jgi:aspartyl-tRNA(Asn)/glutamyl-tRNA(Gln) amidotransferase subunit A